MNPYDLMDQSFAVTINNVTDHLSEFLINGIITEDQHDVLYEKYKAQIIAISNKFHFTINSYQEGKTKDKPIDLTDEECNLVLDIVEGETIKL